MPKTIAPTMKFDYDLYKGRYSMLSVVLASGIAKAGKQTSRTGQQFYCPFHADTKTPSFHIRSRFAQCFGCGFRGDIFDYIREWWKQAGIAFQEDHFEQQAVAWLEKTEKEGGLKSEVVPEAGARDWVIEAKYPYVKADVWHEDLIHSDDKIDYWLSRGFNWYTISRFNLGHDKSTHRFTVPIFNHVGLYGIKKRRDDGYYRRVFQEKGEEWLRWQLQTMAHHRLEYAKKTGIPPIDPTPEDVYAEFAVKYIWGKGDCIWLWNEDRLLVRPQTYLPYCFLTADEMSGITLEQLGYPAVSMGGDTTFPKAETVLFYRQAGNTYQVHMRDVFKHVMKVFITADWDTSGLAGAQRRAAAIGWSKCEIIRTPDKRFKDANDFYVGAGEGVFRSWLNGIPTLQELGMS